MAKMRPKIAKMRPKMAKMRPKMAKMAPKMAKIKAFRRLLIFCQDQIYTRAKKWHQKKVGVNFGGAPKSRYSARDRPKIVVTFFGYGLWTNSEPLPRARQQQNGHFASTE